MDSFLIDRDQQLWTQASVALVAAAARAQSAAMTERAPPRETSWRDLVRRLAQNPAKR